MEKMTEKLKDYLANATAEQIAKDWKELKKFNENGVDIKDFLKSQNLTAEE